MTFDGIERVTPRSLEFVTTCNEETAAYLSDCRDNRKPLELARFMTVCPDGDYLVASLAFTRDSSAGDQVRARVRALAVGDSWPKPR